MVSCSRLGGVVEETQYLEYLGSRRLQISIFRDFFVATWFFVVRRMLKGQIEDGYCSVIIIQFLGRSGNGESRYGGLNFRFWRSCCGFLICPVYSGSLFNLFRAFCVTTWVFVVSKKWKGQIKDRKCKIVFLLLSEKSSNGDLRSGRLNFYFLWSCCSCWISFFIPTCF